MQINMNVKVGDLQYGYDWEPVLYTSNYNFQATEALRRLEQGYNQIRSAILANMTPEIKDDRPAIEHRIVDSGPVSLSRVRYNDNGNRN